MTAVASTVVIIPAAGVGSRFGGETPKQFRLLRGKPILNHVIDRFRQLESVQQIVVAVSAEWIERVRESVGPKVQVVVGGSTRQQSVTGALRAMDGHGFQLVAVHDAVRPFFRLATVKTLLETAARTGAALPATRVTDTIHEVR